MGMAIDIDIRDDLPVRDLQEILDDAFGWLRWVDETFSTYRPESQVSRVGRGELALEDCDPRLREVLDRCEELRGLTDGYFDVRASPGGALDPSGLVKGWAVELASERAARAGAANHCINAGGDVRVRGVPEPGTPWRVGIVHPLDPRALTMVVALSDGAVATSGLYERGLHVFDPHTHRPATELGSVSVIGPSLTLADAYATAALAMGTDAPVWLSGLEGYESLVIDAGGHAWWSAGFPAYRVA
jgi:thiamine biosynthesis lipoprotein